MFSQPSPEHISWILYNCRKQSDRPCILHLHAHMCKCGLEAHASLGNHLVSTLAEVRSMRIAQHAFDRLNNRDEDAWNSIITGYIKCGLPQHALTMYKEFSKSSCLHSSKPTLVVLLRACVNLKDFKACTELHSDIARLGLLEGDLLIGNSLVAMYTDYDLLARAQEVCDQLLVRDVVTWNTLIAAYTKYGLPEHVLLCLEQMQLEGICPDSISYARSLMACGNLGAVEKGEEIHTEVERKGFLGANHVVGSSLVDMYAKCGLMKKAQRVFNKLSVRDAVSWTILIRGYAEHGHGEEALKCFEEMQEDGIFPDAVTLACCLKACVSMGAANRGRAIHREIEKRGLLEGDQVISNMLVDLYAKCGLLCEALQVFCRLPARDAISWNALIAGYAEHGSDEEALHCFEQMKYAGVFPDAITFICLLKACGRTGDVNKGMEIHAEAERRGLLLKDHVIGNTMVDMYVRCGWLAKAHEVFDKLQVQDTVTWTILLAGYADHGCVSEALCCLERMRSLSLSPDPITLVCSLQACGRAKALDRGQVLHADIERNGWVDGDVPVGNTLINMYTKCGFLNKAKQVFDDLPECNVVSWNTLISGYAEHGHGKEAFVCLEKMQHEGITPDAGTIVSLLKACSHTGASEECQEIHSEIERMELWNSSNPILSGSVVGMYAKCGLLAEARQVFEMLPLQGIITGTILMAEYVECGFGEEALKLLEHMQKEGVFPDVVMLVCGLRACGSTGAAKKGLELHAEIERMGSLKDNSYVRSALVHMYAGCGSLAKAQQVFEMLPAHDVVSWNALISGYAHAEEVERVFCLVDKMLEEGINPDCVTSMTVLNACSRMGFLNGGTYAEMVSQEMSTISGHELCAHVCDYVRECFSTAEKAAPLVKEMPLSQSWMALMTICRAWGNMELGKWTFEQVAASNRDILKISEVQMDRQFGRDKEADNVWKQQYS